MIEETTEPLIWGPETIARDGKVAMMEARDLDLLCELLKTKSSAVGVGSGGGLESWGR